MSKYVKISIEDLHKLTNKLERYKFVLKSLRKQIKKQNAMIRDYNSKFARKEKYDNR